MDELEATESQADFQSTQTKQEGSTEQSKLLRILSHREKGRAHEQRTEESKGNLKLQHVGELRFSSLTRRLYSNS